MHDHLPSRTRIALIGDAMIAVHCLRRALEVGVEVVGCLPGSEAFADEARALGVHTFEVGADLEVLMDEPCDWLLSVFNIRLFPPKVLAHPGRGVVNFHDGPLPRYAGLYAPVRALLNAERDHGVTWHLVDDGVDTGDLLVEEPVPIEGGDTALSLQLRCLEAGQRSFERLLPLLVSAEVVGRPQDLARRTCFGHANWSRSGIETDWRLPVAEIRRMVRAHDFGPYENTVGRPRFMIDGRWHALLAVEQVDAPAAAAPEALPGTTATGDEGRLCIRADDGWLSVTSSDPPIAVGGAGRGIVRVWSREELAAIERWDAARFRHELAWRVELAKPLSGREWRRSSEADTVTLGGDFLDLFCGLVAVHAIHGDRAVEFAYAWTQADYRAGLEPGVDPSVISLLHPVAPIRCPLDPAVRLGELATRVEVAIARARRRGPFLRDLLDRNDGRAGALVDPARCSIQVADHGAASGASEAPWTFRRDADGLWSVTGPRWAMSVFMDLFEHRRRALQAADKRAVLAMPRVAGSTRRLLESWEGSREIEPPSSFMRLVEHRLSAADHDRTFVDCPWDGGASDREMAALVDAWSARLHAAGVVPGDHVPVALDRGTPYVAVMLAILRLRAVFVPLDPLAPDERIRRILDIIRARLGVAAPDRANPGGAVRWISSPAPGSRATTISVAGAPPDPDDVAFVIFTSGSTGSPRGVRLTHRNLDQYLETVADTIDAEAYARSAWTSSVAFDSSLAEVFYPIVRGGVVVAFDRRELASAAALNDAFERRRVTIFLCATPLWAAWMTHIAAAGCSIPSALRHVDIGGSVADPELVRRWLEMASPDQRLANRYGPTETTITVIGHLASEASLVGDSVPIGRPERGVEIRILDAQGRRVAPGVAGEIWIGGGQVALGYLGTDGDQGGFQSMAGAKGRWYRTGDRAAWNADGEILFGGRFDDQVKVGGFRVELEEVRGAIGRLAPELEFDVLAIGDGVDRQLAVVARADDGGPSFDAWSEGLKSRLEESLPRYAVPRRWLGVSSIPRTPSGKTDRRATSQLFVQRSDAQAVLGEPGSPEWVAGQVGRVLGRSVDDGSKSFFELGGDSLGAMRLHALLEEGCGRALPSTVVHAAKGIDDLTRRIAAAVSESQHELRIHGHRRYRVVDGSTEPEILFLPGVRGEATLPRAWASVGASCRVGALDLDLDRCRELLDPERGPCRLRALSRELADLVLADEAGPPPVLVGFSMGGWLAFEIAAVALERGIEMPPAILIEPGIHHAKTWSERGRQRLAEAIDSIVNLDWTARLRRARTASDGGAEVDLGRRSPNGRERLFGKLLVDALGDHRPRSSPISARLVVRQRRWRRYAMWRRWLASGVEVDSVDLVNHSDFFRFGSEPVLAAIIERHLRWIGPWQRRRRRASTRSGTSPIASA